MDVRGLKALLLELLLLCKATDSGRGEHICLLTNEPPIIDEGTTSIIQPH